MASFRELRIISIAGFSVLHLVIPAHAGIQYGKDRRAGAIVVLRGYRFPRACGQKKAVPDYGTDLC